MWDISLIYENIKKRTINFVEPFAFYFFQVPDKQVEVERKAAVCLHQHLGLMNCGWGLECFWFWTLDMDEYWKLVLFWKSKIIKTLWRFRKFTLTHTIFCKRFLQCFHEIFSSESKFYVFPNCGLFCQNHSFGSFDRPKLKFWTFLKV